MKLAAVAIDYDGTIAVNGAFDPAVRPLCSTSFEHVKAIENRIAIESARDLVDDIAQAVLARYEITPVAVSRMEDSMATNYSVSQLIHLAECGRLEKAEMADLLPEEPRAAFLAACARVEKAITEACTAHGDFCLASGCAMDGEVCLNALLNASPSYNKACGQIWLQLFRSSQRAA